MSGAKTLDGACKFKKVFWCSHVCGKVRVSVSMCLHAPKDMIVNTYMAIHVWVSLMHEHMNNLKYISVFLPVLCVVHAHEQSRSAHMHEISKNTVACTFLFVSPAPFCSRLKKDGKYSHFHNTSSFVHTVHCFPTIHSLCTCAVPSLCSLLILKYWL